MKRKVTKVKKVYVNYIQTRKGRDETGNYESDTPKESDPNRYYRIIIFLVTLSVFLRQLAEILQ